MQTGGGRCLGAGGGGVVVNEYGVLVWEDEKVVEIDNTVNVLHAVQLCV